MKALKSTLALNYKRRKFPWIRPYKVEDNLEGNGSFYGTFTGEGNLYGIIYTSLTDSFV